MFAAVQLRPTDSTFGRFTGAFSERYNSNKCIAPIGRDAKPPPLARDCRIMTNSGALCRTQVKRISSLHKLFLLHYKTNMRSRNQT